MKTTERTAFERWASRKYDLAWHNGEYVSHDTRNAWMGWQACREEICGHLAARATSNTGEHYV